MVQAGAGAWLDKFEDTVERDIFRIPDADRLDITVVHKRSAGVEKGQTRILIYDARSFIYRKRFREHLVSEAWNQQVQQVQPQRKHAELKILQVRAHL